MYNGESTPDVGGGNLVLLGGLSSLHLGQRLLGSENSSIVRIMITLKFFNPIPVGQIFEEGVSDRQ